MIQQRPDVVNKQRVEKLGDLFLVREVQSTVEGNPNTISQVSTTSSAKNHAPDTFKVHRADFDHVPCLLAL